MKCILKCESLDRNENADSSSKFFVQEGSVSLTFAAISVTSDFFGLNISDNFNSHITERIYPLGSRLLNWVAWQFRRHGVSHDFPSKVNCQLFHWAEYMSKALIETRTDMF